MVSLEGMITIILRDWPKTIFVHFWRMDKTGPILSSLDGRNKSRPPFYLKIPEFNWIIQNYFSFDHDVNEIG